TGSPQPRSRFRNEDISVPISIEGVFTDLTDDDRETIGAKWEHENPRYGRCVRVKWEWTSPDEKGTKYSWDPATSAWGKGGVGGWDTLIASRIPAPFRVRPTDDPATTEAQVVEILTAAVKTTLKADEGRAAAVREQLKRLTDELATEIGAQLKDATTRIASRLGSVFPGYRVEFTPEVGKFEPEKIIGAGSYIKVQGEGDPLLPLAQQGAGVRRTFLWSAIGTLADLGRLKHGKASIAPDRQRILLIEEPESFLHPPVVRAAREALYGLSEVPEWQVLATTHSPVFIDVSKPHTTIVRIARGGGSRTRVFSTERAAFSEEERENLRMVRSCHPTVTEFFFADRVWLLEGETEHAVYAQLMQRSQLDASRGVHLVNCMGKGNLVLFARILNQFGSSYTIIHDTDSPRIQRDGKWQRNGMWTINEQIVQVVQQASVGAATRLLVAQVPDFELQYFGRKLAADKPYQAVRTLLRSDFETSEETRLLRGAVDAILSETHKGLYASIDELREKVTQWISSENPSPSEKWDMSDDGGA
ncbi:MAG: AAA family ATPase, partial [Chloroflexi bacterium]|nr:AAA family ATPase [Chloroflexota bacterium]